MRCVKCNQIIPDESIFCLFCGAKIEKAQSQEIPKTRKIIIERQWRFIGSACIYNIFCDGQIIATIRNGEEKIFEIDENAHSIQCGVGNMAGGLFGGSSSDLVSIPKGTESAKLLLETGFASLKLELIDYI